MTPLEVEMKKINNNFFFQKYDKITSKRQYIIRILLVYSLDKHSLLLNLRAELSGTYGPSCPLRAELSTGRVVHGPSCPATIIATPFTCINRYIRYGKSLGRTHQQVTVIWWNLKFQKPTKYERSWVIVMSEAGVSINDVALHCDIYKTTAYQIINRFLQIRLYHHIGIHWVLLYNNTHGIRQTTRSPDDILRFAVNF